MKWHQPPLPVEAGIEGEADIAGDAVRRPVDDGDRVIGGVGHIGERLAHGDAIGAGPADGLQPFHHLADLEAGLQFRHHRLGREIHGVDAHRLRRVGGPKTRQTPAVRQGQALLRLLRGNSIGCEVQHLRVPIIGGHAGHERVFKEADVTDIGGPAVRAETEAERQPTDLHRSQNVTRGAVEGDQAIVRAVKHIELRAVRAHRHVAREAVLITDAAELAVELVFANPHQLFSVHQRDGAALVLGEIDGAPVRREHRAHEAAAFNHRREGSVIARQTNRMRKIIEAHHGHGVIVQQHSRLFVRRNGDAVGLVGHLHGAPGRRDQTTARQDADIPRSDAGRRHIRRREEIPDRRGGCAAGDQHKERRQDPERHRNPRKTRNPKMDSHLD